jgi:hypothetical protein
LLLSTYSRDLVQEEDDGRGEAPAVVAEGGGGQQAPQEIGEIMQDATESHRKLGMYA